ncbi:hypothetical protein ASL20_32820 [Cupriavidus necator]|nr:IS204/IS1001/IS1096/IS1165 transposase [Cupriavidus sp. GA3-3]KUE84623.1 hypothetical protein ASL20_32820 [Cupriavidus necator]
MRQFAGFYRLAWTTIKRIDLRNPEQELGLVDLVSTVIAMDEFAVSVTTKVACPFPLRARRFLIGASIRRARLGLACRLRRSIAMSLHFALA